MKLRIKDNSLRFRLDRSDVAALEAAGRIEATTPFGGGARFRYALEASGDVDRLTAQMESERIVVYIPEALAEAWTQTGRVGLEAEQTVGEGGNLHILVEKDLGCRHPSSDAADGKMFEHLRSEGEVSG